MFRHSLLLAGGAEPTHAQCETMLRVVLAELPGGGVGEMPLTPAVRFMVERGGGFGRFNQTMTLELPLGIDRAGLVATLAAVIDRHEMLRARLDRDEAGAWRLEAGAAGTVDVDSLVHHRRCDAEVFEQVADGELDAALDRLDPAHRVVVQFVWLDLGAERSGRLIVAAHHLVVDGVSWRILLPDFVAAWGQIASGQVPRLAAPVTSMRRWAHALVDAAPDRAGELELWQRIRGRRTRCWGRVRWIRRWT